MYYSTPLHVRYYRLLGLTSDYVACSSSLLDNIPISTPVAPLPLLSAFMFA
jgi:hypothetical protein